MTEIRTTNGAMPEAAADKARSVMAPARSSDTAPSDWRGALPAELRGTAEKFSTPADAVRSYAALEKRLGRSVAIPPEDASTAEIDAFHARLGRPPTADGYRAALPDGLADPVADPEGAARLAAFLESVHGAGATPGVVRAAADWYVEARADAERTAAQRTAAARAEAEAALRREWGAAYDRRLSLARRAVRHFGGDDLASSLDRSGLGNDPAWLRAFARVGQSLAEDALLGGETVGTARDVQGRIDSVMETHFGKPTYASPSVQSELRTLYETLYGAGPARPDAG